MPSSSGTGFLLRCEAKSNQYCLILYVKEHTFLLTLKCISAAKLAVSNDEHTDPYIYYCTVQYYCSLELKIQTFYTPLDILKFTYTSL